MKRLFLSLSLSVLLLTFPVFAAEQPSIVVTDPAERPTFAARFETANFEVYVPHDDIYNLEVVLTNLSSITLATDGITSTPLRLATVRPHDQVLSPFYNANDPNWINGNRIRANNGQGVVVNPGEQVNFLAEVKAPSLPGKYLLALAPVVDGVTWVPSEPFFMTIVVDNDVTPSAQYVSATEKRITINTQTQRLHQQVGGDDLNVFIVSTGKNGYNTPTGDYHVDHKNDVRYSRAYDLYMDNWMGLANDRWGFRGYGIHKLPYWKTRTGRIYEGEAHLGRRVSHGCIRLGYEESKTVYDWADIGTDVKII
ncbi:MAG: hypothetical protein A2V81_03475 [Candidatus Abawacabacteria bacterium RBG_16_42_10]|uniref:L,D-TPase catalytic domain-containing protein n=1 Tax=Candidatus Abawacabacteria bacterium RBG_16_42_10 TaxID=1817814 RepID=A0A1F4XNI7_9BACT|nr:MAG: hypothetical protein A2V81_03475 [Candidatus Abawacabacteria bacterium RBG_16_42_10]